MPQVLNMFIRIINKRLLPMRIPIGDVLQCNSPFARYLVKNNQAVSTDESGTEISNPWEDILVTYSLDFSDPKNSFYIGH